MEGISGKVAKFYVLSFMYKTLIIWLNELGVDFNSTSWYLKSFLSVMR